jgi:hypothetical protein
VVDVELTPEQVDDAVEDAKRWWQMWVGQMKSVMYTLTGGTEYNASDIATDIDSIVDVVFEYSQVSFLDYFKWADVEINPYQYVWGGEGGYSALLQYIQYREMAKQIVSSERDWEWDRARRKLIVMPQPDTGVNVLVTYLSEDMEMSYLTNYELKIFMDYALSQAMKILATIRMKYAGKPSSTGEFSMDGDALYANGEALEKDTEEKARMLQAPTGLFAE